MAISFFEQSFLEDLKEKFHFKLELVNCFPNQWIPKYILLDKTRNIHSYYVLCKQDGSFLASSMWDKESIKNSIIRIVATEYSEMDRTLFFLIKKKSGRVLIAEGNAIRESLLESETSDISQLVLSNAYDFSESVNFITSEL